MLSDDEARELRELQRRVFRHGDALDAAELARLDELTRRAEESAEAQDITPETRAREEDVRDLLDGIGEESSVPAGEPAPARRRGRIVVASLACFAVVAAFVGAFVVGRSTAPTPPAAMERVLQIGEDIAREQGWATWNYAGALNGIDYFAGSLQSGEHCVLPVSTAPMPLAEPLCVTADTTELVLRTDVYNADGGGEAAMSTSILWNSEGARLQTSIDGVTGDLAVGPGAGASQQLMEDRQSAVELAGCEDPPSLLNFSIVPGADVFGSGSNAVTTSYWACVAGGARAAIAVKRDGTTISWLDDQDDPAAGMRATSADFAPDSILLEAETGNVLPGWHWRVEWPLDGDPTLVPALDQ